MSRRGLLRTAWAATGVAVLATAGATVPWLRRVSVLGVRSGNGPQGVPVNHTAVYRGVVAVATSPTYRLTVAYGDRESAAQPGRPACHAPDHRVAPHRLRRGLELRERPGPAYRCETCSTSSTRPRGATVLVESLQEHGGERVSTLAGNFSDHPHTLVALELDGEPLSLDHGFPCATDRARPSRCPADQVGPPAGGDLVMRAVRSVALVAGIVSTAYGVWLLLGLGWANTRSTLVWLVGGVVLHDGVFAVLVTAVALAALRLVPDDRLAPWVVALVILVPVTLLGIPELGRFGARTDNPTLLDRHYWLGWSVMVTLVVAGVLVGAVVRARATRRRTAIGGGDDDTSAGGR